MSTVTADSLTSEQVAQLAGVTYRRLNYWTIRGLITPEGDPAPGSGNRRRYHPDTVRLVIALRLLTDLGMEGPRLDRAARQLAQADWTVPARFPLDPDRRAGYILDLPAITNPRKQGPS